MIDTCDYLYQLGRFARIKLCRGWRLVLLGVTNTIFELSYLYMLLIRKRPRKISSCPGLFIIIMTEQNRFINRCYYLPRNISRITHHVLLLSAMQPFAFFLNTALPFPTGVHLDQS